MTKQTVWIPPDTPREEVERIIFMLPDGATVVAYPDSYAYQFATIMLYQVEEWKELGL